MLSTSVPRVSRLAAICLLGIALLGGQAGLAGTDVQVTHDPNTLAQNETCVVLNRGWAGNIVIAYNDVTLPNHGLGVSYSLDNGASWASGNLQSVFGYEADPSVASDRLGRLYAGFISIISSSTPPFQNSGIYVCKSLDGGATWTAPVTVDQYNQPSSPSYFCDKSFLTVDTFPGSAGRDRVYIAWQRDNANGVNADIYFASSGDQAQTFQYASGTPTGRISDLPSTPSAPTYASSNANCPVPVVGSDGTVYVSWQDAPLGIQSPAHMWIDKSTDGGQTFGTDVLAATFDAVARYPKGGRSFMVRSFPQMAYDSVRDALHVVFEYDPDRGSDARIESDLPPGSHQSQGLELACHRNYVYAVWADGRNGPPGSDIYFNRSTDGGMTWGTDQRLNTADPPGTIATGARIAADSNYVYVAWMGRPFGQGDVFLAYSTDYGTTWSAETPLDTGALPGQYDSSPPAIAAQLSDVYVAWSENYAGDRDLLINWSNNAGASWQFAPVRLDHAPSGNATGVQLAAQGPVVCATWVDTRNGFDDIYFNNSFDQGGTWQGTDTRIDGMPGGNSRMPCLRFDAQNVYVAWTEYATGLGDIHFNHSTDFGMTWQPGDVRLDLGDPTGAAISQNVDLASAGSNVYAVWEDYRNGSAADVYFTMSGDNGVNWGQVTRIEADFVPGLHNSTTPKIAVASNCVQVVWVDRRHGQGDIYRTYSLNNGTTWYPKDVRLDTGNWAGATASAAPRIAATGANVYVGWQDARNGLNDIYFSCSSDSGKTWRDGPDDGDIGIISSYDHGQTWTPVRRVNNDLGTSGQFMPWIKVKANGVIDVVWYDRRNDPFDSYLDVYLGSSQDGGLIWINSPVTDAPFGPSGSGIGAPRWPWRWMGDYIGFDVSTTYSYIAWCDMRGGGLSDIYFDRFMNPVGTAVEPQPPLPQSALLKQNWPNPCNPSTTIEFAVPVDAKAHLCIFDLRGRCMRTLVDDLLGAGWYRREWDGRDDAGREVAAGTYVYRLTVGDQERTEKLSLVR